MKRQQIHIIDLNSNNIELNNHTNQSFIKNIQTAVLLALLKQGQLSKQQFDFCYERTSKDAAATYDEKNLL